MNPSIQFQEAMADAGLVCSELPVADSQIHRFHADGDRNDSKNGWYVFHDDGIPAGAFGNWKNGDSRTWCARNLSTLSDDERQEHRQRMERAKRDREEAQREDRASARHRAGEIWKRAKPAGAGHPYLKRKHIAAHGVREDGSDLIVLLRDTDGTTHTLQRIRPNGEKRFLTDGAVSGHYYAIGKPNGMLYVVEGFATGASIHEATGQAVAVAFDCGNLMLVAKALRAKYPDLELVIAADNDQWSDGNPGVMKAREAAIGVKGKFVVPQFKNLNSKPTDFNDLACLEGAETIGEQLAKAAVLQSIESVDTERVNGRSDADTVRTLATLSDVEYDKCREETAKDLGIRVTTLDGEVKKARRSADSSLSGRAVLFEEIEPWPDSVDGAVLLDELSDTFSRYIILPDGAADTMALWAAYTHVFEAFLHSPRLNLSSPQKGCAKTLALDVLQSVTPRSLRVENMTTAVLFRLIEKEAPTLLIDECDSFLTNNEDLRGGLNAGHKRGGGYPRCEGDSHEVRIFKTFAPVALAGIKGLPETLQDRSIVVTMKRALPGEVSERFDSRRTDRERKLNRKLARWASDNFDRLGTADPDMRSLYNRKSDNWRPLIAVAEAVGGDWPERAWAAVAVLEGAKDDESTGVMLLGDIRDVFEDKGTDWLKSVDLAEALATIEGRPWGEWGRSQKPISANALARQLKPFDIKPALDRKGQDVGRGYDLKDFDDAFARYTPSTTVTPLQPSNHAGSSPIATVTPKKPVTVADPLRANEYGPCNSVTVENPEEPAREAFSV